ncbi:MAG: hypothetical protein MUO67_19570 [Anaerolineales bacterium]|nr:hypothetical protein [Anaerolineales bacterium]
MKYLIIAKPGTTPMPPDQGADILQASRAWMRGKLEDGTVDVTYNFFGGGGFGIVNARSHEECLQNLLEIPIYPFYEWEVKPILDFEGSYNLFIPFYQKLGSM